MNPQNFKIAIEVLLKKRFENPGKGSFKKLEDIESYFAFPGMARLRSLNAMLDRMEHTALAHKVTEITKLLVSDRYRSNPDFIEEDEQGVEATENGELSNGIKRIILKFYSLKIFRFRRKIN